MNSDLALLSLAELSRLVAARKTSSREIVEAFGIPIYEKDGYEADDIIGTLSVQATQQGVDTVILTGDMDTLQLVNEHVQVLVAKRGISEVIEYDEAQVMTRYSLPPAKLPCPVSSAA